MQIKLLCFLLRSKLDYGCFVYGPARTSYLKALDAIHHLGFAWGFSNISKNDPPLKTYKVVHCETKSNLIILNQKKNQFALEFKSISMTIIYLWILSNQPATLKLLKPVIDIYLLLTKYPYLGKKYLISITSSI